MAPRQPWAHGFHRAAQWGGAHPVLCAAVFFVFSVALRLLLNGCLLGVAVADIVPDEIKYLHLAKSIAEGGPLLVNGALTNFQKILYPLFISPAFLLAKDPVAQIKIIGVINCWLMSSMVFPTALLVKRLTPKPPVLLLSLAFAVAAPDFIFTSTFMSETLYWPLCIWVFYLFHRAMVEQERRKRLFFFALLGFFTYLSYLTKEIGAAFLIAAAAMLIYEGIRDRRFAQNWLALLVSMAGFFVPLLIVKQALFPNMGNSYAGGQNNWNQLDITALANPETFGYLIFSAAVVLMAAVLSFFILPVLLPLFGLRELGEKKRRMYLFAAMSLVASAGAIAFAASIRDPRGEPIPRWHLRMLAPIVIPFIIICFDFLLCRAKQEKSLAKREKGLAARAIGRMLEQQRVLLPALFCVALFLLLPTVPEPEDYTFDHATLTISYLVQYLRIIGADKVSTGCIWKAFVSFMLAATAIGIITMLVRRTKATLVLLLCVVFAVSVTDNLLIYSFGKMDRQIRAWEAYCDETAGKLQPGEHFFSFMDYLLFSDTIGRDHSCYANAVSAICDFFLRQDDFTGSNTMICLDDHDMQGFDTYVSQHVLRIDDSLSIKQIWAYQNADIEGLVPEDNDFSVKPILYLIVSREYNPFTNVEVACEEGPYLVLRNLDPTKLCLLGTQS